MREDVELFLSCIRFSSREQVRQVNEFLSTDGASGTVDGSSEVLLDLIPKLRRAEPRTATLLANPLVDAALARELETLRSVIVKSLKRYESLSASSKAALPAPDKRIKQYRAAAEVRADQYRVPDWANRLVGRTPPPPTAAAARARAEQQRRKRMRKQEEDEEELIFKHHRPLFCSLVLFFCTLMFLVEVANNGWQFCPLVCPSVGPTGLPTYEDGTPCEANLMLGVPMHVLDGMGAKNDVAIFEHGEWWRLFSCSWLHSGYARRGSNPRNGHALRS